VDNSLINSTRYSPSLLEFMDFMFITQSRCEVVGIYHSQDTRFEPGQRRGERKSCLRLLNRVRNDSGVRVGQVIAALGEHTATVLSTWTTRAKKPADQASTGH
jgi:hypothetical protein